MRGCGHSSSKRPRTPSSTRRRVRWPAAWRTAIWLRPAGGPKLAAIEKRGSTLGEISAASARFERLDCERTEFKADLLDLQARKGLHNIGAAEEGVPRSFNCMPD